MYCVVLPLVFERHMIKIIVFLLYDLIHYLQIVLDHLNIIYAKQSESFLLAYHIEKLYSTCLSQNLRQHHRHLSRICAHLQPFCW